MILHKSCPICSSNNLTGYAIDCFREGPHISRVKCKNCGIVFANPMADESELIQFYKNPYIERFQHIRFKEVVKEKIEFVKTFDRKQIQKEAPHIDFYKTNGRFLDIGCGLGLGLAYAHALGFELYATEYDPVSIDFVKSKFDVQAFQGDLLDAKYPDNYFDFIYISHVIEHVLDPINYLKEMHRVLKPGGILAIGTPDISSNLYKWYRVFKMMTLSVPLVIDGLEHTFIFPKNLLYKVCKNQGFNIKLHYGVSLGETIKNLRTYDISLLRKIARYIQNFFKINQWIVCEKL